ncbi:MAG TPA: phospholipid carrier-dependent glycosyltransferase [Actinomycetota bacterium]|nr:phospholipid carrier-dependent glycosyltransferase [Actinomycetota bacterium]
MLGGVTALGAVLRFVRLSIPRELIFDEVYYARDACLYLGHRQAFCGSPTATEQSYVHPPLGKWIVAAGIRLFGYHTFGWRFMAAVFGTALVALAFVVGWKLLGRWAGAATGLLVATDFLLIVQSRVAMLDIFLAFFVVLGFLFVVFEHERVLRLRAAGGGRLDLRWRLAAGAAFGAAVAVKWSGGYALAGAGLLVLSWTVGGALALRRAELRAGAPPRAPSPLLELNATLLSMALAAVGVYLASYAVWFYDHHFSLPQFWTLHRSMLEYHLHLTAHHAYASRAWTWPLVIRPVAYYFHYFQGGAKAAHVLAFGNPATWWPALGAGAWFLYRAVRRRHGPETIVMTAWLAQYLPWITFSRPQFFFYMAPIVPFMMMALAGGLRDLVRGFRSRTPLGWAYVFFMVVLATAIALWFYNPTGHVLFTLAADRRIVEVVVLPFLLLALAALLGCSEGAAAVRRVLVLAYLVYVAGFVLWYLYPVIGAVRTPYPQWLARMLFRTWI